jgi:hypothetical protein
MTVSCRAVTCCIYSYELGGPVGALTSVSRPVLGPAQPPVQCVPAVLSTGVKHGRGVTLTTHPHLVPRMIRSYTSSPPYASMRVLWGVLPLFSVCGWWSAIAESLRNTDLR